MSSVNRPGVFLLLRGYKEGYVVLAQRDFFREAAQNMSKIGLIKTIEVDAPRNDRYGATEIFQLTGDGVRFVQANLVTWLKECYLYQVKPAIVIHDEVEIVKTLQNDKNCTYVMAPHTEIEAGKYVITQIGVDNFVLSSSRPPLQGVTRRVRAYECRQHLKLSLDKLGSNDVELKRRLGAVRPKTVISKLLSLGIDNLKAIELMNQLRESEVAQGRWDTTATPETVVIRRY